MLGLAVSSCDGPDTGDEIDPFEIRFGLPLYLRDPGTGDEQDGRITLGELFSPDIVRVIDFGHALDNFWTDLHGQFEVSLDLGEDLPDELQGTLGTFGVALAEPGDLSSIEFNADFGDARDILDQFRNLSIEQILDLVRSFVEKLKDSSELAFMNYEIPVIDTLAERYGRFRGRDLRRDRRVRLQRRHRRGRAGH